MSSEKASRPAARKPRGHGPERRGEILAAAKRIFAARGFSAATMREIAAESGLSAPALYLYFADKEAMLSAIADDMFERLLHAVQAGMTEGDDPLDAFRRGVRAYVAFGRAHPTEYRLIFMGKADHVPRPGRRVEPGPPQRAFDLLVHAVARLPAAAPRPPRAAAETVWAAMHGLTALMIDFPDVPEDGDQAAAVDALIDMALAWLTAR